MDNMIEVVDVHNENDFETYLFVDQHFIACVSLGGAAALLLETITKKLCAALTANYRQYRIDIQPNDDKMSTLRAAAVLRFARVSGKIVREKLAA